MTREPKERAHRAQFAAEIEALRLELRSLEGPADFAHLRKLERWGRWCTIAGFATAWIVPNPLSALLISQGIFTRWTIVTHAVSHRAYDRIPGVPPRYTSRVFARGWRRFLDWFDWIVPAAWHAEHDVLHHFRLGTEDDPDLLEHNTRWIRRLPVPTALRRVVVFGLATLWKPAYYAPNTLKELFAHASHRGEATQRTPLYRLSTFSPMSPAGRALWMQSYLPYALFRFALLPALAAPLGSFAVASVLANSLLAEILTNLHSFAVIAPNHAGEDVPRFDGPPADKGDFYWRQIVGSVNYRCGGDALDFLHGWLNYQIEHHVFPDIPLRQYALVQPKLQALCERYDIPYTQEPLTRRLSKAMDVMVGRRSMPRGATWQHPERPSYPIAS